MNEIIFVRCIGIDDKIHECEPDKNICRCGIKVKSKKLQTFDYLRSSCYECTY